MTDAQWVQPNDDELRELPLKALNCRAGRHYFGDLLSFLRQADHGAIVRLGGIQVDRPCKGKCGVFEIVEWNLNGQVVGRRLDYSRAKDAEGNSLYLLPKGSGRLHPDDARGELFKRMGLAAGTQRRQQGAA